MNGYPLSPFMMYSRLMQDADFDVRTKLLASAAIDTAPGRVTTGEHHRLVTECDRLSKRDISREKA